MNKTYSEMIKLPDYASRFNYLKLGGKIGIETFGVNRYLNQLFYSTPEWRRFRTEIIIRDMGFDLGDPNVPISGKEKIYIHHINPITEADLRNRNLDKLLNPDNAISCSYRTHKDIHYGSIETIKSDPIERRPGDTKLW